MSKVLLLIFFGKKMFWQEQNDNIILWVKLTPNASNLGVKGVFCDSQGQEFLRVGVVSVPEKGKANKELIAFFQKKLGVPKSQIEIVSGNISHYKKILLKTNKADIVEKILLLSGEDE